MSRVMAKHTVAVVVAGISLIAGQEPVWAARSGPEADLNRPWAKELFAVTPAHRLVIVHEDELGDTKLGRCAAGGSLRLGDKTYLHGIGVNSQSTLRVMLGRPTQKLVAVIGLDRNVDNTRASCRFHVRVGNKEVFATGILRANAAPRAIDVPLNGATAFDLIVDDAGDGRGLPRSAAWLVEAERMVVRKGSVAFAKEVLSSLLGFLAPDDELYPVRAYSVLSSAS